MKKIKVALMEAGSLIPFSAVYVDRDNLEEIYKLLNCSTIDIVKRKFFGKEYFVVCDDEGLLKNNSIISTIIFDEEHGGIKQDLVGNLLICNIEEDEDGELNLGSLEDLDYLNLNRSKINFLGTNSDSVVLCVF